MVAAVIEFLNVKYCVSIGIQNRTQAVYGVIIVIGLKAINNWKLL